MNKLDHIIKNYKNTYAEPESVSNEKLIKDFTFDYETLIGIRNKVKDTEDDSFYEEDFIVLDHVLDFYEILIKQLKKLKGEFKNDSETI